MVFLINADARNIISTQATFITRYEDSDKKPVRYLYITAYKLNMEKIGLTSRLGKVNIMMLKRANFFSASPKTLQILLERYAYSEIGGTFILI